MNVDKKHTRIDVLLSSLGVKIKTVRSNTWRYEWNQICCESSENKVKIIPDRNESFFCHVAFVSIRRELEQRLRELKRRKKDKKAAKQKEFEEEREKDKKRWTDFNSKVSHRSSRFPYFSHHSLFCSS